MGGAFLAAAVFARLGSRIGLPTIPLFMLAGILLGPHTPGVVLVEDAHDFEMLSALGLVLLLFYLGLEFHLDDLRSGGRRLLTAGGIYLLLNVGAGLGFGFALGWGAREALVLSGVLGISSLWHHQSPAAWMALGCRSASDQRASPCTATRPEVTRSPTEPLPLHPTGAFRRSAS